MLLYFTISLLDYLAFLTFTDRVSVYSQLPLLTIFSTVQAMVIVNGYLYVFGGTTGYLYSTDLHRLDLTTREWAHLKPNNVPTDLPEERSVCREMESLVCVCAHAHLSESTDILST